MSRSNPAALAGMFVLGGLPPPERATEPLMDEYLDRAARYIGDTESSGGEEEERGGETTPTHNWGARDAKFVSGHTSVRSWGVEDGAVDALAEADVQRMFDKINGALYEGRTTGTGETDMECQQWRSTFHHIDIKGMHLIDSLDDGTDFLPPPLLSSPQSSTAMEDLPGTSLTIVGHRLQPVAMPTGPEFVHIREEVLISDGLVQEYLAFNSDSEDPVTGWRSSQQSRRRRADLPPITPSACLRDAVCSQAFDQIWNELVLVLQPLVTRMTETTAKDHSGNFSVSSASSPPGSAQHPPLQPHPYIPRGLRGQPTLMKAPGQAGAQYLRFKHSGALPPPPPSLPPPPSHQACLTGVMKIRSLPLQQRGVTLALPPGDLSRECSPLPPLPSFVTSRPDSSLLASRPGRHTPLPSHLPECQLPATPAMRLISSRATARRTLRPIEAGKAPALPHTGVGFQARGYRLTAPPSPPATPWLRHAPLPPLEPLGSGPSQPEQSPPLPRPRNRVTFSRLYEGGPDLRWVGGVSASAARLELRPSTSGSFRAEAGVGASLSGVGASLSRGAPRKSSETLPLGPINVTNVVGRSIAEDGEAEGAEEGGVSFSVTGTSGFLQSKPRSGRSKPRGYVR